MNDYLAYRLKLKNEGKLQKEKKRVKIAPYSKKRQRDNREYAQKSRPWWKGKQCAIRAPGCSHNAEGIHHMKGKSNIELLLDERFWLPSCHQCNSYVEQHHEWAVKKGFKLSRLKEEQWTKL